MAKRHEEAAAHLEISKKAYQTTWLLSLFLGPFGVERFYLGQWRFGLVKIGALFYAAVAAALFGPSFLTFGPFVVLYLYDLGNAAFGRMRDRDGRTLRDVPDRKLTPILVSSGVILVMLLAIFAEREPSGSSVNEANEAVEEEVPEVVFSEGIMPDYLGMNAAEVFETLDLIDERESNIYWPSGLEPRDDDWEQESQAWTVCEQDIDPGAPID
jgi:TM2 domain-containing membrane protein YozV